MILEQIEKDLKEVIKSRDLVRVESYKAIKVALIAAKNEKNASELTEEKEISILQRLAKQREESSNLFLQGGRPELSAKELAERSIILEFIPALVSDEELEKIIVKVIEDQKATKKDMGNVMKEVKQRVQYLGFTVDGKSLSTKVSSKLS